MLIQILSFLVCHIRPGMAQPLRVICCQSWLVSLCTHSSVSLLSFMQTFLQKQQYGSWPFFSSSFTQISFSLRSLSYFPHTIFQVFVSILGIQNSLYVSLILYLLYCIKFSLLLLLLNFKFLKNRLFVFVYLQLQHLATAK